MRKLEGHKTVEVKYIYDNYAEYQTHKSELIEQGYIEESNTLHDKKVIAEFRKNINDKIYDDPEEEVYKQILDEFIRLDVMKPENAYEFLDEGVRGRLLKSFKKHVKEYNELEEAKSKSK